MNNKNLVISILGVLLLLASVIGATFAFFSYNKIGTKDNTITTGSLSFNYLEGENALLIENMFPMSDEDGMVLTGGTNTFTFTISGYSSWAAVQYTIVALQGGTISGKTRLGDGYIKAYLTGVSSSGTGVAPTYGPELLTDIDDGQTIGEGSITGGTTDTPIVHTYTYRMWVSDDLYISNTETSISGKTVITGDDYSNKYYTVNIKVFTE